MDSTRVTSTTTSNPPSTVCNFLVFSCALRRIAQRIEGNGGYPRNGCTQFAEVPIQGRLNHPPGAEDRVPPLLSKRRRHPRGRPQRGF
ncbi:hypothetical protein LY76DRAFT_414797 [Colletotrichum caudatum]|nr:hypothetical protein LY76DRAFT_414797 [Colletotrichum caudatum]